MERPQYSGKLTRLRITAPSMKSPIGQIAALFRYPVKSMAGEYLDLAELGWHGIAGDRRLAFRRGSRRLSVADRVQGARADPASPGPFRRRRLGGCRLAYALPNTERRRMAAFLDRAGRGGGTSFRRAR